jgi:pantoate--beta-alanine ligase
MNVVHTIEDAQRTIQQARQAGKTIGLVPTMGALHAGHGSLIEAAVKECDFVVVTIFVNPTQFGPGEDLEKYPRTLDADIAYCEALNADLIFAPSGDQMYPQEQLTWVEVEKLTEGLCGCKRPGHFKGVTTVCAKLFNIVRPDSAYFGQKDAQQVIVIQRMVQDLNIPLKIQVSPIVREANGLAMSSRNQYLSPDERARAVCLYEALTQCKEKIDAGRRDTADLTAQMKAHIEKNGGRIDYVEIVDVETLEQLNEIEGRVLIALAVYIGKTRLIDNLLIDLNQEPKTI